MPTKEQIELTMEHLQEVVSRRYIEGDGELCSCWFQPEGGGKLGMTEFVGEPEGTPWPFDALPSAAKVELLITYVSWEGFTEPQEANVIQRVVDGESSYFWMDGVAVRNPEEHRGTKTYQVFHYHDVPSPQFPEDYTHVADVQANGLRETVEFTRHENHPEQIPPWFPWEFSKRAEALTELPRDTLPGDVIVDPQGNRYRFQRSPEPFEKEFFVPVASSYEEMRRQAGALGTYRENDKQLDRD